MTRRLRLAAALSLAPFVLSPAALAQAGAAKPAAKEIPPFEVVADATKTTWYGRFGRTNCAWVDMGDAVLVIDAGGTEVDTRNLVAQVKETTKGKPIRWVVATHLHADSNSGLKALLGPSLTVVVHGRVAAQVAASLAQEPKGKSTAVVGVGDKIVLATGSRVAEVVALPSPAHTDHDLIVSLPGSGTVFVGDLVTPQRCPMLSDPNCDPDGWLKALALLDSLQPSLLVPTRGNATALPQNEVAATRSYINRVLTILAEAKKQNFPEARVSSTLVLQKVGEYCPPQLDSVNALALYKRMGADGKLAPAKPPAPKK